jgi:hypothetical protein
MTVSASLRTAAQVNQQAANRRRTRCNQTAVADTQRQQTLRSAAGSQRCCWSTEGRTCFHCDDACGSRGLGLTRVFTGLVPLP